MATLAIAAGVALLALGAVKLGSDLSSDGETRGATLSPPIDARQQTAVGWRERSHWLQPWRGYLDTPPATRLRDAIGINFDVEPGEAEPTARLLSASGFTRARVEVSWDRLSYDNPSVLSEPARLRTTLDALRRHHIRPLILLNANHNAPGPTRAGIVELAAPAPAGTREVRLATASARQVQAGRTGLNDPGGKAADVLFTSVDASGAARLSKPLPRPLPAGPQAAATLRYEPFGPPRLSDGRPNPRFEATMAGWLEYARTVVRETRAVLGDDAFDVEVWNELGFGSDFLFADRYYSPPRDRGRGDVTRELLERTIAAVHAQSPRIGIGDGFANQTPFPSGATSPRGLTAIDKHPYHPIRRFPANAVFDSVAPLDARGKRAGKQAPAANQLPRLEDEFVPTYEAFFPEYTLTAIQTETLIRDLSPITTEVRGTPHGRSTHPPGGSPPEMWITEANLDPTGADPSDPSRPGSGPIDQLREADVHHLQAKAALRYYTAFVNKGVTAVDLFAVKGGHNLSLVDPRFFRALSASGGVYPGDRAGGEMPRAVGRLAGALRGARALTSTQPLSLLAVSDDHGHFQFDGNQTAPDRFPPLYDRDVLAFFPFQLAPGHWVAAVYVMTRNLARPYGTASGPRRYDLPEEKFRITVGGLRGSRVRVRATDPLSGQSAPATVVSRAPGRATIEVAATDSPRLLSLDQR